MIESYFDCSIATCSQWLVSWIAQVWHSVGFPGGSVVKNLPAKTKQNKKQTNKQTKKKNLPANTGDLVLIPGLGRSAGEGYGNTLQYFCLEHPLVREAGRLQSMGSQRVGHDLATKQQQWHIMSHGLHLKEHKQV